MKYDILPSWKITRYDASVSLPRYTQSSNVFIVLCRIAAKRNVLFSFVKNVVINVTNIFFYRLVIDIA